jgi:hypothetical protein
MHTYIRARHLGGVSMVKMKKEMKICQIGEVFIGLVKFISKIKNHNKNYLRSGFWQQHSV